PADRAIPTMTPSVSNGSSLRSVSACSRCPTTRTSTPATVGTPPSAPSARTSTNGSPAAGNSQRNSRLHTRSGLGGALRAPDPDYVQAADYVLVATDRDLLKFKTTRGPAALELV